MDEKDWEILKVLSEELNITNAAEKLFMSQPALSYRLKQIEKEFGVSIVARGPKGIQFTNEGEYILGYALNMLLQLRNMKDFIANSAGSVSGTIRLGVSSSYAHFRLPSLLKKFLASNPNVQLNVTTGWSSEIMQLLRKEEVQIAIVRGEHLWDAQQLLLSQDPICIISNEEIKLADLPRLARIDYKTDKTLYKVLEAWWYEHFNIPPHISMQVDKVDTCKEMVKNCLGYAIIPEICLVPGDNLFTIKIASNNQITYRNTWLMYRESSLRLTTIKAFVNFMQSATDERCR